MARWLARRAGGGRGFPREFRVAKGLPFSPCIWKSLYYDCSAHRRELSCAQGELVSELGRNLALPMECQVRFWSVFRVSCRVAENVRKCHALGVFWPTRALGSG